MVGIVFLVISLYTESSILTASLGVTGFSCLWSIKEIFEQEERVNKGWYPKRPK